MSSGDGDGDEATANGKGVQGPNTGQQSGPAAPDPAPAEPTEPPGPARPQPPAMTPLEVAGNRVAMVRVHCDARCGAERCLYAADGPLLDEHDQPYPDPREVVMAAAGCFDDPPACPGATDHGSGAAGVDPDRRAAVLAVSSTPDLAGVASAAHVARGPMTLPGRLAALHGDAPTAMAGSGVVGAVAPLALTTADVHGITSAGANPATATAIPYAVGADVAAALRGLGIDPAPIEAVLVPPTVDDQPDPDPGRPENDDPTR